MRHPSPSVRGRSSTRSMRNGKCLKGLPEGSNEKEFDDRILKNPHFSTKRGIMDPPNL